MGFRIRSDTGEGFQSCGLGYVNQSADELRLSVIEGDFDDRQITILESDKLSIASLPGFEMEVRIIGASHFLTFRTPGQTIHEVFACIEIQAKSKRAFYGPLSSVIGEIELKLLKDAKYRFSAQVSNLHDSDRWRLLRRKADEARDGRVGLSYEFPGDEGDTPLTIITAWVTPELPHKCGHAAFCVESAHTYPNEGRVVHTATVFEYPKEGDDR